MHDVLLTEIYYFSECTSVHFNLPQQQLKVLYIVNYECLIISWHLNS